MAYYQPPPDYHYNHYALTNVPSASPSPSCSVMTTSSDENSCNSKLGDETGTLTVQNNSVRVLAEKVTRQLSKIKNSKRGKLVTTCYIVSASENAIPPVMIFPRVHFKSHMLAGTPCGTLGLTTKAEWMNTECFVEVLKHFIKHTSSSKDNPSFLIMNNHKSHISIEGINLCKDNGVTVLTVPPHPLDVGLLKPFHTFHNDALCSWEKANLVTIYQIASFVGISYPRSLTPVNIAAAFKKTGIHPYDRRVFNEEDSLASQVTERTLAQTREKKARVKIATDTLEKTKIENNRMNEEGKDDQKKYNRTD
ncbi:hypothetical protein ILUMI_21316 [Ignelater luminosus]|uniref:DDE-1 domain-containing protein n=1 Tax=Ignelater luminosus TaxID=2038154 RepID=A0A8K0CER8_IGNLU|nr:hypothetical protein ILUMI_21316 [Ignelater luminosus]